MVIGIILVTLLFLILFYFIYWRLERVEQSVCIGNKYLHSIDHRLSSISISKCIEFQDKPLPTISDSDLQEINEGIQTQNEHLSEIIDLMKKFRNERPRSDWWEDD